MRLQARSAMLVIVLTLLMLVPAAVAVAIPLPGSRASESTGSAASWVAVAPRGPAVDLVAADSADATDSTDNSTTDALDASDALAAEGTSDRPATPDTAETLARSREQELLRLELEIDWRDSTAVGLAYSGRLIDGVQLPIEGQNFFTWDAVHDRMDNPGDRRWGTDDLLLTVLAVLDEYRAANPGAPRVGISDLSRRDGGEFGTLYGGLGHRSHQNGLDVDIAYPRKDGRELGITSVDQVDLERSQDLVDRFVAAGAQFVFIGEDTDLRGPPGVVTPWPHHNDHMHVRIHPSGN